MNQIHQRDAVGLLERKIHFQRESERLLASIEDSERLAKASQDQCTRLTACLWQGVAEMVPPGQGRLMTKSERRLDIEVFTRELGLSWDEIDQEVEFTFSVYFPPSLR